MEHKFNPSVIENCKRYSFKCFQIGFFACSVLLFTSCRTSTTMAYSSVETKVLSLEVDQTVIVRVQGKGRNAADAELQAEKQAVHDVMFKNLYQQSGNKQMVYALINNPNVEKEKENYFVRFFGDKGEYKRFVLSTKKERNISRSDVLTSCVLNVSIDRIALKNKLLEDGIIY